MQFTFQFPVMQVHKAGCADLKKARNISEQRETVTAATVSEAIAKVLGDESDESTLAGMGYSDYDFKVLPCSGR